MNERYVSTLRAVLALMRSNGLRSRQGKSLDVRRLVRDSAGLAGMLLSGCTLQPLEPGELAAAEYRRDNARVEAIELFEKRRQQCAASDGVMHVPRSSSGRLPPTPMELRLATCNSRRGPIN